MTLLDWIQRCKGKDDASIRATLLGFDVCQVDEDGRTALIWAADSGQLETVRVLIALGCPVNQADHDGYTPLILAAANGHSTIASQLLAAGAEINHVDKDGYSSLMHATQAKHSTIVSQLLATGAEVNPLGPSGLTPLMLAATVGSLDSVRLLMEKSDLGQINFMGRSALDCAIESRRWDCADLLAAHDPYIEGLVLPQGVSPVELPQWHASLERKSIQTALRGEASSVPHTPPTPIKKNSRTIRL